MVVGHDTLRLNQRGVGRDAQPWNCEALLTQQIVADDTQSDIEKSDP